MLSAAWADTPSPSAYITTMAAALSHAICGASNEPIRAKEIHIPVYGRKSRPTNTRKPVGPNFGTNHSFRRVSLSMTCYDLLGLTAETIAEVPPVRLVCFIFSKPADLRAEMVCLTHCVLSTSLSKPSNTACHDLTKVPASLRM